MNVKQVSRSRRRLVSGTQGRLAVALLLAPALGCGFINVNGKPLGGSSAGGGSSTGDGQAAEASNQTSGAPADANTMRIEDVTSPAPTAALSTWTAAQQWQPFGRWGSDFGYGNIAGGAALVDELGPRLSELGRASFIEGCLRNERANATAALGWAVCGLDVTVLDLKKLGSELAAAGIGARSRNEVMKHAQDTLAEAKKIGAAVEAAAKDDPGVAAILGLGEAARSEWAAYATAHQGAIDRFLALKDAVRSGKSTHPGFAGCFEATVGPFTKLVRQTKLLWDGSGSAMPFHVQGLTRTVDGYVSTVAYAACAYAQDESGASIYVAAANQPGGGARLGARSLTVAKAMDPAFAPKFADRSLSLRDIRSRWESGITMPGINFRVAIMTPSQGVVAQVKRDDTGGQVIFQGNTVDECLEWADTNRVSQVSSNGTVSYQKVCKKRGRVANQTDSVHVHAKYLGGITPGVHVVIVDNFPVVAWRGKQITGVLGVAMR